MTVLIWRIATIVSAVFFLAGVVLLLVLKPLKNKYYFAYEENELLKTEKTANSVNSIYFTSGETQKYIKKYVLCKTAYDRYLVCNYAKKFGRISYYVVQYDKQCHAIRALRVSEANTTDSSRVISLLSRCAYVNIVIAAVEGAELNARIVRPLALSRIRLHALLCNFVLFTGLFVLRHFVVECIAHETYIRQYLGHLYNYIALGASFLLALLGYALSVACYRRKNVKALSGEVLEYEFV